MSWNWVYLIPIVAILSGQIAWVITTAIKAKHGYPVIDDWGATVSKGDLAAGRKVELLTGENDRLKGQVGRLEERIAVLERIATDPAHRLTREIDGLR